MVGRYLMDTVGSSMSAMVPALVGMPHYNSDGYGNHVYVPWWMWDRHKELNFAARLSHRVSAAATACPASARSPAW